MELNDLLPVNDRHEEPPMNRAIEECLAMSGYDGASREMTIQAWLMIGFEYLARERGRERAVAISEQMTEFVATAKPANPWPK